MNVHRLAFGLGLIGCSYVFTMPFAVAAVFLGMMLTGFGLVPNSVDYEEAPKPEAKKAAKKPSKKKK